MTDVPSIPDDPDADDRLRELLRTVNRDAAPVDRATLEAIRQQLLASSSHVDSTSQTDASSSMHVIESASQKPQTAMASSAITSPHSTSQPRKRSMFVKLAALSVAIMSGAALWIGTLFGPGIGGDSIALGEVLRSIDTSESLHLELVRGDDSSEVWIRQPGEVRRQASATQYEIIRGSRLWRIDEGENTVVSENSPLFEGASNDINFFDVVGLEIDPASLMDVESSGRMAYEGVDCDVFETTVEHEGQQLSLTWYADRDSHHLRGIVARDRGLNLDARPIMEVRLIAVDEPVDESLFVVADSLSEDGRIGKVLQAQGILFAQAGDERPLDSVGTADTAQAG